MIASQFYFLTKFVIDSDQHNDKSPGTRVLIFSDCIALSIANIIGGNVVNCRQQNSAQIHLNKTTHLLPVYL